MSQNINILEQDISEIIGLKTLPEEERVIMLRDLGELVFESAFIRLIADLSNDQIAALNQYSDNVTDSQILLKHLFEHYPGFQMILEEEMQAFKEEAMSVFTSKK